MNKRREVISKKAHKKGKAAARGKVSKGGQKRISEKIEHLIESGEFPNTPEGRAKAAGMAYAMERKGRLRRGGRYVRKHK